MKNKALVDKLDETLTGTSTETLGNTLGDVETLGVVRTVAHTLPGAETNTVENTLVNVTVEALIDKLSVTQVIAESDTWGQEGLCGNQNTRSTRWMTIYKRRKRRDIGTYWAL